MSEAIDPSRPTPKVLQFLTERHLATLTIIKPDGSPHVTPVGLTFEPKTQLARVITWATSWKAKHVATGSGTKAAICQVDGGRWLTLYGTATITNNPDRVAQAVARYTDRYRQPKERSDRVVIEIAVNKIIGRG